ncbi:glycerophosphodiester phosphodiesterase, periplasmic-like [Anticarsia gemmatalis]|uniref:glycerophosphodiester phosphodiesterase, periplasmic-like n=1 Tax=Anticarsia gemmatalis TaxID=129554 RepID=UPI003F75735E
MICRVQYFYYYVSSKLYTIKNMNRLCVFYFVRVQHILKQTNLLFSTGVTNIQSESLFCRPLVIAHRGASGYVPEHTLGSYALAILMGTDYIEPDLVLTSDHQVIARHDNELGLTTDIALHPEFASRRTTKTVDGAKVNGWFTEDFTLPELKTLRAIESLPEIRPGNARLDHIFQIPTLQEIIDLTKGLEIIHGRKIGLYPEIKHSLYFRTLGFPIEQLVVDILHKNGYEGSEAPACIQSFEIDALKELKNITQIRLMQLYDHPSLQPFDQYQKGADLTYGDMAAPDKLSEVAKYAYAVGPDKSYIIPRDQSNRLGRMTNFVNDAHEVGLKVYAYTFRAENHFLSAEYISGDRQPTTFGNFSAYLQVYYATGIDGIFCDHPDVPVRLRNTCSKYPQL